MFYSTPTQSQSPPRSSSQSVPCTTVISPRYLPLFRWVIIAKIHLAWCPFRTVRSHDQFHSLHRRSSKCCTDFPCLTAPSKKERRLPVSDDIAEKHGEQTPKPNRKIKGEGIFSPALSATDWPKTPHQSSRDLVHVALARCRRGRSSMSCSGWAFGLAGSSTPTEKDRRWSRTQRVASRGAAMGRSRVERAGSDQRPKTRQVAKSFRSLPILLNFCVNHSGGSTNPIDIPSSVFAALDPS